MSWYSAKTTHSCTNGWDWKEERWLTRLGTSDITSREKTLSHACAINANDAMMQMNSLATIFYHFCPSTWINLCTPSHHTVDIKSKSLFLSPHLVVCFFVIMCKSCFCVTLCVLENHIKCTVPNYFFMLAYNQTSCPQLAIRNTAGSRHSHITLIF